MRRICWCKRYNIWLKILKPGLWFGTYTYIYIYKYMGYLPSTIEVLYGFMEFLTITAWWWLEPWNFEWLSIQLGMENHPNWRTHSIIFQRGRVETTNQKLSRWSVAIVMYPLVMTNSSPWKDPPFLRTVNHLFLRAIYTMAM